MSTSSILNAEGEPRAPGARPYHHGDLRRVVIETAMAMLNEDCGWRFTLREVARRANVSHAAPYKHFPDKAALLAEMALLGFDRLAEALEAARPVLTAPMQEEFLVVAKAYVRFAEAHSALYRLMFSADAGNGADVHLNERSKRPLKILLEALERGQREGLLRNRPVLSQASGCWAHLHGIAMLSIEGLLTAEKVGPDPIESALMTLFEGLGRNTDPK